MTDDGASGLASGLHDRPTLVLDPGFHTARINRADAAAGFAVTASDDKTVRVFDLDGGRLVRTIRLPAGPGNVGKAYAVALSPDGALIAAGGWTRWTEDDRQDQIYLFDRETGELKQRIDGFPTVVFHLAFSPDGRFLAATLAGGHGLRVYERAGPGAGDGTPAWAEVARDTDYGDASYGAAFAPDGRLATTSYDGRIRLYDAAFRRLEVRPAPDGRRPFAIAFHPAGDRLAVGYADTTAVSVLDGHTLAPLPAPDTAGLVGGDLGAVAWSADGAVLFAAGRYGQHDGVSPIFAWAEAGAGARRALSASADAIVSLVPLAPAAEGDSGDLLVAAQDPWLARLAPLAGDGGTQRWTHGPPQADLRAQERTLAVSADGSVVDFGYEPFGEAPARFDVTTLALTLDPTADDRTAQPEQAALPVADWVSYDRPAVPTLDGAPLPLRPFEASRSLAIAPIGDRFVLGTEWRLRAFAADGSELWQRRVPGPAWAVNVTGDGRLVVAAYGDGTIRWHRMDDGRELLAFFPLKDRKNWVCWTPEGYYYATPGAHGVLRWHVNHGWDRAAEAIPVENVEGMRRPDVLPLVLQELDIIRALGIAELNRSRAAIRRATGSAVAPGARLHVLAMGVSDYGAAATHLRLNFAAQDAHDVASALSSTQGGATGLYAAVLPQLLKDADVTRDGVMDALAALRRGMEQGDGRDVAVVLFSGHGALIDGTLYLLTQDVNAASQARVKTSALPVGQLNDEIAAIARHGRVLLLLDACRSGATADGAGLALDARGLRVQLAQQNVTVLTSSSAEEASWERDEWQNGAFTEALLDALREADFDKNGLIGIADLTTYLTTHVPRLTDGAQRPEVAQRFQQEIFAAL